MASEKSPADEVEKYSSATAALLNAANRSPDARAAGAEFAKALQTVGEFANTLLLPLAAANYGALKFRKYMTEKFAGELTTHLMGTPSRHVVPPRAVVAGPVLDALVYAHEEEDVRKLYLALLARAMDDREPSVAHPAFVDVLKQIDSAEVGLLRAVLCSGDSLPIVAIHEASPDGGSRVLISDIIDWRVKGVPTGDRKTFAYIQNWSRLGLIKVGYDSWLANPHAYSWVAQRPEYLGAVQTHADQHVENEASQKRTTIQVRRGLLRVTSWGEAFATAVGIETGDGGPIAELGDWTAPEVSPDSLEVVWYGEIDFDLPGDLRTKE